MINQPFSLPELTQEDVTESNLDLACFAEPVNPQTAKDLISGIEMALRLDERPVFLEGLSERLTQLGTACTPEDTSIMLTEVKRRYKAILGKPCPRTVLEWIRGTKPGVTNRQNHYDLCFALEMDERQTASFFQKHFLTLPWGVKSRIDAVFLYCLHHGKPYADAVKLLAAVKSFPVQETAHTATAQIFAEIIRINDDEVFLDYLSRHCYNEELNALLVECGFAQLYVRHPFDCLLLYCANSYDPILTLHLLNERN